MGAEHPPEAPPVDKREPDPQPKPDSAADALLRGAALAGGVDNAQVDAAMARFLNRPPADKPARKPAEPDGLNETPPEQRLASVEVLAATPAPSGEDQIQLGKLVASLAATSPDKLTPELLAHVTASPPGARAFMQRVVDMPLAEVVPLLGRLPVDARKGLFDELGTDGHDLPLTVTIVASLLIEDPDLASEAIAWGGQALAQALAAQLGDDRIAQLPAAARTALMKQLRDPDAPTEA